MYPALLKNGDILFLDLSHLMCHQMFFHGELSHESYAAPFLNSVLKPGDVFIDVGANIGYITKVASKLVGNEGIVHAIEPMPEAIRLLEVNCKNLHNIVLHKLAASDVSGTSLFSIKKRGDTSALGASPLAIRQIKIQVDTLDNILAAQKMIDVLKIDVEGYELEVLRGAKDILDRCAPLLYFEYIDAFASERRVTIKDYKSYLSPFGYTLAWVNPKYPDSELTSSEPSCYVIGIPNNNKWSNLPVSHLINT